MNEDERAELHRQKRVFRDEVFRGYSTHPRLVDIAADLLAGVEPILIFAQAIGASDEAQFQSLWDRANIAPYATLDGREENRVEQDPAERLLGLLRSALATGKAHLSWDPEDTVDAADSAKLRGYYKVTRRVPVRPADGQPRPEGAEPEFEEKEDIDPRGRLIGWWRAQNIYLEPQATMEVTQLIAKDADQPPLPFTKKGMGKRLAQAGKLESSSKGRNTAKFPTDGVDMDAWHILAATLYSFLAGRDYDEEFLAEQEGLERRRVQRERLIEVRRDEARKLRVEEFAKLLDPYPTGRDAEEPSEAPTVGTPTTSDTATSDAPATVAESTTTTPTPVSGPTTTTAPRRCLVQSPRTDHGFLLDQEAIRERVCFGTTSCGNQ